METIHTVDWMKQVSRSAQAEGRVIGMVPTMGALHEGHFSLVRLARRDCSPVVVSIFVNPLQFGPAEDLERYPRRIDQDRAALESLHVDYLFMPGAAEMYPENFLTAVTVERLSERLEGRTRPGHFRGVATVVLKLFQIVQPRFAYFGRKDAQQERIIRLMVRDLALDTEIVTGAIVREPDGLAMSSRNAYLDPAERRAAASLSLALRDAAEAIGKGERNSLQLIELMRATLGREPLLALDYAEIVDADSLEPVPRLRGACLMLLAARVGKTRLIDNALVTESGGEFLLSI
jgi:pantoate--beta-alanine ligase